MAWTIHDGNGSSLMWSRGRWHSLRMRLRDDLWPTAHDPEFIRVGRPRRVRAPGLQVLQFDWMTGGESLAWMAVRMRVTFGVVFCLVMLPGRPARAETGYEAWLRYAPTKSHLAVER